MQEHFKNDFDNTLKICCYKFCNPNSAKAKDADIKQYIIKWWNDHRNLMDIYNTQESISKLMGLKNRGSITSYLYYRVATLDYDNNTKLIRQWLFEYTLFFKMYKE